MCCMCVMVQISIKGNDDNRYTFNYVFGPTSTQEEVYNTCVTPLLESAFDGYNATSTVIAEA